MPWYCLHLKGAEEFKAEQCLMAQGFNVYLPRHNDRTKDKVKPLFPCYCFIQLEEGVHDFGAVKHTRGVRNFSNNQLITVPEPIINKLKQSERSYDTLWQTGDKVRLIKGPFQYYQAVIKIDKDKRLWAVLDMLGEQKIRVESDDMEALQ